MNLKEKITIIIPTYNRYDRLLRLLRYYESYNFPANIKILDSSIDKNKTDQLKRLLKHRCIEYMEYLCEIEAKEKISDGVKSISTLYAVFCADDDFITPVGLEKAVDFLESHDEYATAHGKYALFIQPNKPDNGLMWRSIYSSNSMEEDLASERLFEHLAYYSLPTFYAVHKTKIMQLVWNASEKYTDDYSFGELLPTLLTVIYGKTKVLNILYSAREYNKSSTGQTYKNISNFIKDGSFDRKYQKFRECLTKELVSEEDISKRRAQILIDKAMNKYLGSSMLRLKIKARMKGIVEKLYLFDKFYLSYRKFKNSKKQTSKLINLPPIEYDNPGNPYYPDFVRIKEAIEKNIIE